MVCVVSKVVSWGSAAGIADQAAVSDQVLGVTVAFAPPGSYGRSQSPKVAQGSSRTIAIVLIASMRFVQGSVTARSLRALKLMVRRLKGLQLLEVDPAHPSFHDLEEI